MNEKGKEDSRNSSFKNYSSRPGGSTDRFSQGRGHSHASRPFRGVPSRHGDRTFDTRRYSGGYGGSRGGNRGSGGGHRNSQRGGSRGRGYGSGYRGIGNRGAPGSARRPSFQRGSFHRSGGDGNRRQPPYYKFHGGGGPGTKPRRWESDSNQRGSGNSSKYGSSNTSHRQQLVGYPSESYSRDHGASSSSSSRQKYHSRYHSYASDNGTNNGRESHNYSSSSHNNSRRHDSDPKSKHGSGKTGGDSHLDCESHEDTTQSGQSRESCADSAATCDPSRSKVENPPSQP